MKDQYLAKFRMDHYGPCGNGDCAITDTMWRLHDYILVFMRKFTVISSLVTSLVTPRTQMTRTRRKNPSNYLCPVNNA